MAGRRSACDFYLAYGPMGMQTTTVASYCSWGGTGEFVAGAGLGMNLLTNETWSLGVQSDLAWVDYGEVSNMHIPVMVAATFDVGETALVHVNGGVRVLRFAVDIGSQTHLTKNYDPALFAGISLPVGSLRLSGGVLVVRIGEGDVQVGGGDDGYQTDFSFGGGVRLPLGG